MEYWEEFSGKIEIKKIKTALHAWILGNTSGATEYIYSNVTCKPGHPFSFDDAVGFVNDFNGLTNPITPSKLCSIANKHDLFGEGLDDLKDKSWDMLPPADEFAKAEVPIPKPHGGYNNAIGVQDLKAYFQYAQNNPTYDAKLDYLAGKVYDKSGQVVTGNILVNLMNEIDTLNNPSPPQIVSAANQMGVYVVGFNMALHKNEDWTLVSDMTDKVSNVGLQLFLSVPDGLTPNQIANTLRLALSKSQVEYGDIKFTINEAFFTSAVWDEED